MIATASKLRGDKLIVTAVDAVPTTGRRTKYSNIRFSITVIIGWRRNVAVSSKLNADELIV